MAALTKFLNLCTEYLAKDISGEQFKEAFEMYMFDYGDDIEAKLYIYLDNILDAVTYFDPSEVREDDEHYMQEDELREAVQENYEKIKDLI